MNNIIIDIKQNFSIPEKLGLQTTIARFKTPRLKQLSIDNIGGYKTKKIYKKV